MPGNVNIAEAAHDPKFLQYINSKKELLDGLLYNRWQIPLESINNLAAHDTIFSSPKKLYAFYRAEGLNERFIELVEYVSSLSIELKDKYKMYKYPGKWKELNQSEYKKLTFDDKRVMMRWGIKMSNSDCNENKMLVCKRGWERLQTSATEQFWLSAGEFCKSPDINTEDSIDISALKPAFDCRLMSCRNFLDKINAAANNYSGCLKFAKCQ